MTVILEIAPDAEQRLNERAARRGQTVADYLVTLSDWEDYDDLSLSEEEIAIVNQGLEELHAGDKGISLEEFHEEMMATFSRIKKQEMEATA